MVERKRDPEKVKVNNHRYYLKHKKECSARNKQWRLKNRDSKLKLDRERYWNNREENLRQSQNYAKTHRKQLNKYLRKWKKNHPMSVFIDRLRNRIYKALKGQTKASSTKRLIGCSVEQLKLYLEKQFISNMTWNNYGKWHVDHIKPCAKFDLSKVSEQKKCFHYTNLQPLWAKDNLSKGARMEREAS